MSRNARRLHAATAVQLSNVLGQMRRRNVCHRVNAISSQIILKVAQIAAIRFKRCGRQTGFDAEIPEKVTNLLVVVQWNTHAGSIQAVPLTH